MKACHDFVEELIFQVTPEWVDKYVEAESSIMVKPLSKLPGFLGWEIHVSQSRPGEVRSVYFWEDEEAYRGIDPVFLDGLKAKLALAVPHEHIRFIEAVHEENKRYRVRLLASSDSSRKKDDE